MLSDTDQLQDGTTFDEFHRDSMATFNDFRQGHPGTNWDNFMKYLDSIRFVRRQNLDEIDRAHAISYQHGLQLDNTGDEYGIPRNGLADDTYRFLLMARAMVRNSNGTLDDVYRITANLLGCETTDLYIKRDRDYNADGTITGVPNTLDIMDVPYSKVKNMFLLDRLPGELERSTIGDTKVNFVNLSIPISTAVPVTTVVQIGTELEIIGK